MTESVPCWTLEPRQKRQPRRHRSERRRAGATGSWRLEPSSRLCNRSLKDRAEPDETTMRRFPKFSCPPLVCIALLAVPRYNFATLIGVSHMTATFHHAHFTTATLESCMPPFRTSQCLVDPVGASCTTSATMSISMLCPLSVNGSCLVRQSVVDGKPNA